MSKNLNSVLLGSLLFQVIQLGSFPILISQLLVLQGQSGMVVGLVVAIPWISILVLGPVVPAIIARFGSNVANLAGSLITATAIIVLLLDDSLLPIIASTILIGMGLILRWVNCDTLVIGLSEKATSGRSIGIHEALMGLGLALGPLLFAFATLEQVKWVCLGLAIAGQLAFSTGWTDKATHSYPEGESGKLRAYFRLISVALLAAFVAGFIESSSTALFPIYFGQFGFPLTASAVLVSSFGFGGTLLQPPLGWLADRKGYEFAQFVCSLTITLSCITMYIWSANYMVLMISLFIFGGAVGGLNTLAVLEAGKTLKDVQIPAAMTAIAMLYTLGGVVGPITSANAIPLLDNFGMIALFCAISVILAVKLALNAKDNR